jgi:hypothetical protein
MAWKYNNVIVRAGRSWTDQDGIRHPYNWASWSDEEKTASGLVWEDDPAPFDSRFYWDAETPKELDDLKSLWMSNTKKQAGSILSATDWYVVRSSETGTDIPADISTYRTSVRAHADLIEVEVAAIETHSEFVATVTNTAGDSDSPFSSWPEFPSS